MTNLPPTSSVICKKKDKKNSEDEFNVLRFINNKPQTNQREIAKNLGFIQKNDKKISIFLDELISNKIILNSTKLVDGLGSKRVAKEILKIVKN